MTATAAKPPGNRQNTVSLLEVVQSSDVQVDEQQRVIRGVRVLGSQSLNGRRYSPEAIREAKPLYEGLRVNYDHPSRREPGADRLVADRAGWLANIHEVNGGLSGDLHYLASDPRSQKLIEAAQRRPDLLGLSHNAEGRVNRRNGQAIVEEIIRVRSVDIVSDPASTKSLFESQLKEQEDMPDEFGMDAGAGVEAPAAPASSEELTLQMFLSKATEIFKGDGDPQDKAKRISNLAKTLLKVEGDVEKAESGGEGGGGGEGGDGETPESRRGPVQGQGQADESQLREEVQQLRAREQARDLLESNGYQVNKARVTALAALSKEEDRKALLETWTKDAGGVHRPRSERPTPIRESGDGGNEPVKDSKEFGKLLKSR